MASAAAAWFTKGTEQLPQAEARKRCGRRVGIFGICMNLMLFTGKFIAGMLTGAISITADAFNNLSDAGSSVVTLVGYQLAGQKADADHPFGHGRFEYLAGLLISVVILVVGVELGKSSLTKILHPSMVEFSAVSVVILAVSVCVKLFMGLVNRSVGNAIKSAPMAATAVDSFSDAVATTAVLVSVLVGHLTGLKIDGWMGLVVALIILKAGVGTAKDTLDPLLGQPPEPETVKQIAELILSHPEVVGIHDLVIHDYGPGHCMMSVHAEVPADADVMATHDAIDHIERELREKLDIEAVIHMDPIATSDPKTNELHAMMADLVRTIDPAITIHDFRITPGPSLTNMIFDAVVPYGLKLTDDEVKEKIDALAKKESPNYYTVVSIDRTYVR